MEGWFKALDAHDGHLLWQFKAGSGIIGQPVTYKGPDGKQYVAILSGVGGWAGGVVSGGLNGVDGTGALGFAERHGRSGQIYDQGRNALCLCAALGSRSLRWPLAANGHCRPRVYVFVPIRIICRFRIRQQQGFENKLADLLAASMNARARIHLVVRTQIVREEVVRRRRLRRCFGSSCNLARCS